MLSFIENIEPEVVIAFISMVVAVVAIIQSIISQKKSIKSSNYERVNRDFYNLLSLLKDVKKEKFDDLQRVANEIMICNREDKINKIFEKEAINIGEYFRILHQIFKYLNTGLAKKNITLDEYELFIQILRTQFSGKELQFIMINSIFTIRGVGIGVRLISSNFFGNVKTAEKRNDFYNLNRNLITDDFKKALSKTTYNEDEDATDISNKQNAMHIFMVEVKKNEDKHNLIQLINYFEANNLDKVNSN